MRGIDRRFRLARLWSNRILREVAPLFSGSIVNVSAGEDIDKEGGSYSNYFTNSSEYHLTNYAPGSYRGFQGRRNEHVLDLRSDVPAHLRRRFDVAISHTVLEHVFDVFSAFRNTCELSRDIVIIVVPFAQVQHENSGYEDFWRFSPTCLRRLFQENGLDVVHEAVNDDVNAAVYLLVVGSRNPERWRSHFPKATRIHTAGDWIGRRKTYRHRLKDLWTMLRVNYRRHDLEGKGVA